MNLKKYSTKKKQKRFSKTGNLSTKVTMNNARAAGKRVARSKLGRVKKKNVM